MSNTSQEIPSDLLQSIPQAEQPIYTKLQSIREKLLSLKRATQYPDCEIQNLWLQMTSLVKELQTIRSSETNIESSESQETVSVPPSPSSTSSPRKTPSESNIKPLTDEESGPTNQVDVLIDDVYPMFFQFFDKGVGKLSEQLYPNFVQLAKIKYNLEEMKETGVYNEEDLESYWKRLEDIEGKIKEFQKSIESGDAASLTKVQGMALISSKLHSCFLIIRSLREEQDRIHDALRPIQNRLVEIKRELSSLLGRRQPHAFSLCEVQILQEELRDIDDARIDGKFVAKTGEVISGQALVIDLLESCFDDVHELLALKDPVTGDNPLRETYEDLIKIKARLEKARLVHRWAVRPEDLIPIQMKLGEIDSKRVDGKFLDEKGQCPEGQAVLHLLLHKCYRLVYILLSTSEPVSPSLMPLHNQLITLRKCLVELRRWKVSMSSRELIPYQMKLASIDNKRVDGKFLDAATGEVGEGQGLLHDLLFQCFELLEQLKLESVTD